MYDTILDQLSERGYTWDNPDDIIVQFEKKVAAFAGCDYAVAVDSCSHGLFLSLKYLQASGEIRIPKHTYVSVPMQIMHAGCTVKFTNEKWSGEYRLLPYLIFDGAVEWRKGMYNLGLLVLSFQHKKHLAIGKGGMILTDDSSAVEWLRRARHDGRTPGINHSEDNISTMGWHYNMTPEQAAKGILIMDDMPDECLEGNYSNYKDLTTHEIFK